jgi:hypothetical protein
MALNTPQFGIPTSLVFTPRDFSKDMAANQASDTAALQNLFKFGTHVYDYAQSRKQADLMDKDSADREAIEMDIENDKAELTKLKNRLAELKGGV